MTTTYSEHKRLNVVSYPRHIKAQRKIEEAFGCELANEVTHIFMKDLFIATHLLTGHRVDLERLEWTATPPENGASKSVSIAKELEKAKFDCTVSVGIDDSLSAEINIISKDKKSNIAGISVKIERIYEPGYYETVIYFNGDSESTKERVVIIDDSVCRAPEIKALSSIGNPSVGILASKFKTNNYASAIQFLAGSK